MNLFLAILLDGFVSEDDEEIGAATLGWLDAHGFSGSQARPRPLPAYPTRIFFFSARVRALACREPRADRSRNRRTSRTGLPAFS